MHEDLKNIIDSSKKIVFFGGAGVSTESGIPDFRSADGIYFQKRRYPPELCLSHDFFFSHTKEFYEFYREKMLPLDACPSGAHKYLAYLEISGRNITVITQNIDGLHQKAGSRKVLELHGSVHRNYCLECKKLFSAEYIRDYPSAIPKCDKCGGLIKPDVVLYGEPLDTHTVSEAVSKISEADLMIVGGTSLTVYPAAGLIDYFRGNNLVLINKAPTHADRKAKIVINEPIGEVLSSLMPQEQLRPL